MNFLKKNLTLSLLIFIGLFLTNEKSEAQCHIDDWTALKALYESTDGDNWRNNTGWQEVTGDSPTVNCNLENLYQVALNVNGRVDQINFLYNGLNGTIPPELANLSEVRRLYLHRNELSGNIPAELGNLTTLTVLQLKENQLSGNIPPQLGNLTNLKFLNLNENQLSGSIPSEIGNLNSLISFTVSDNNLSGCYDDNLKTLCQQLTSENDNEGISDGNNFANTWENFCNNNLGNCICNFIDCINICNIDDWTALKILYESTDGDNWTNNTNWEEVTGNQPTPNCYLENLYGVELDGDNRVRKLDLRFNQLNGNIPSALSMLNQLEVLNLKINGLSGNIPPEFGSLSNLKFLDLSRNALTGNIPSQIGNLANLEQIYLYTNQLSGGIPPELGNLSSLYDLYLNENQLSGNIPSELGNLNILNFLFLNNNQLSGSLFAELGNLPLSILRLDNNNLSGCYDNNLANICTHLWDIENYDVSYGNNFDANWEDFCATNAGACSICSNDCLSSCHIDDWTALKAIYENTDGDNWLNNTGWQIVTSATQPPNCDLSLLAGVKLDANGRVSELNLGNNLLNGSIPTEIDKLTNLIRLKLGGNTFTTIPPELGNLTNLVELRLNDCGLSSNIPPALGNLSNIIFLFLENNQLSGNIPTEFGDLTNMTRLYLRNNNLSGTIPPELSNANSLGILLLGANDLSGSIPGEFGNLNNLNWLDVGDNDLTGCFDPNLLLLCSKLTNGAFDPLFDIDWSNNFDATWEDFCDANTGECPVCSTCQPNCHIDDWTALKALYESTDGDNWINNSGWETVTNNNPPVDCNLNNLFGIDLDVNGRVSCIDLDGNESCNAVNTGGNGLIGNLPVEIGNLSRLAKLNLRQNQLSGSIPAEIGNLAKLRDIDFSFNSLSGNIPAELGNLTLLEDLDLSDNNLSGSIPVEILNLESLAILNLDYNQLSGNIPVGLQSSSLLLLNLSDNNLTGTLPSTLGNIQSLREIRINDNQLSGCIPAELGNLSSLFSLVLYDNNLVGCYDENLKSICNQLVFNDNYLISDGNNFDADWQDFCASDAGVCSNTQCHIDDWTALKALYESTDGDNWFNNSGWEILTGNTPPANCNLSNLIGVTLNAAGRVICIDLDGDNNNACSWQSSINGNGLTGSIPPEIGELSELNFLYLGKNQLTGSLPIELGNLVNLKDLHLQYNQLTGDIPFEMGNLVLLEELELYNNNLSGSIPAELSNLNNLSLLDLSRNQLSGNIPPELGSLSELNRLHLSYNNLSGNIPSTLGNILFLTDLYLNGNQLTGSIPAELGNAPSIFLLDLTYNNLSGCYDDNLSPICYKLFMSVNWVISDGNNFDADWEDFCASDAGVCLPCPSDLVITATTPFQNEYQSGNTISTNGMVTIDSTSQVEYKSNRVTLNEGFSVKAGAQFKATYGSCE